LVLWLAASLMVTYFGFKRGLRGGAMATVYLAHDLKHDRQYGAST
jgi:hypothetical protein